MAQRVSYALVVSDNISISQTTCSHREGYATRRVGPEARPLEQHRQGAQGARQTGVTGRLERVIYSSVSIYGARRAVVMPAPADIQAGPTVLDPGVRRDDVSSV